MIACGALAHEIAALRKANGWSTLDVVCLPPELHNRPEKIAGAVREQIRELRKDYDGIFVAYADCGTRGELDKVLAEEGVERMPGRTAMNSSRRPRTSRRSPKRSPGASS